MEKRSRQSDVLSDMEQIMLRSYTRNELDGQLDGDIGSDELQRNTNPNGEVFISLLNTNSRENMEITIEPASVINSDITTQVTRK